MKLLYSPPSPFARKARILIHELNLSDKVSCVDVGLITPVSSSDEVLTANPLGLIPVLYLNDTETLYDSTVICEYLDNFGEGSFFPTEFEERIPALKLQALADGLLDMAVALRYEVVIRPLKMQWFDWQQNQINRIELTLNELENQQSLFSEKLTIGELTVACALGYLDFRFAELNWRESRAELSRWYEGVSHRPSIQSTEPNRQ